MMTPMELLLLVKGPLFHLATGILVIGLLLRLAEILLLGRAPDFAEPRASGPAHGLRTLYRRFVPDPGTFARAPLDVIVGTLWHVGFILILLFFIPHVELIKQTFGVAWPALPNPLVDAITAITLLGLVTMLVHRLTNPVKRFLSTPEDWLIWTVTFLPVLTGYLTYHRLINPYPLMLSLHILSVELLMVVLPFTKLTHIFTAFVARYYNGAIFGRKGVQS